jgi:hypothetical protein
MINIENSHIQIWKIEVQTLIIMIVLIISIFMMVVLIISIFMLVELNFVKFTILIQGLNCCRSNLNHWVAI